MLQRCIKSENLKLKHSYIWVACLFIPCIPAVMGTFNYLQNLGILKSQWHSLWTQLTLFYANFFYAPLIALYCSYLWRMEHLHNNWNALMTSPVPIYCVFLSKLAVIVKVTLCTQLWLGVLFFISGKLAGLPGFIPLQILFWLLRGTLAALAIGALQLLLSMVIRSFSLPIGIALGGSVAGMLISNQGGGTFWPYSLMLLGMNSNKSSDLLAQGSLSFLLSTAVFFLLFTWIGIMLIKKRDVKA